MGRTKAPMPKAPISKAPMPKAPMPKAPMPKAPMLGSLQIRPVDPTTLCVIHLRF